jgi:flavin reductase (DIM6/NTAB) family NADH-FMN oxidoreductase RutF
LSFEAVLTLLGVAQATQLDHAISHIDGSFARALEVQDHDVLEIEVVLEYRLVADRRCP